MKDGSNQKVRLGLILIAALALIAMLLIAILGRANESGIYEFHLNERDVAIETGDTVQLEVVPDEEKYEKIKVDVSWVSEKPSVATVDEDGLVTGKAGGETRVKAIVKYAGIEYSASCVVTVKAAGLEYSTYKIKWFTQRQDRSGYEVIEETYERMVGSEVELTVKEASQGLPANYILNTKKSILTGTVKEQLGVCVLEVYYDVAEIAYSVDYYYESDTKFGTYPTKETKAFKTYAFSQVTAPMDNVKTGFVANTKVKGSVLENSSVTAGSKLKVYCDRIRSNVTISYLNGKSSTYTNVYGVGLIDAPANALSDSCEPYYVVSYVNGEKQPATAALMKTLTADSKVEFKVDAVGFDYINEKGGTLLNTSEKKNTDSYVYLNGASDVIYLSATYDLTGFQTNMVGITLRSGGTSREIRFQYQGVGVMKDHTGAAGTLAEKDAIYAYNTAGKDNTPYVWAQNKTGNSGTTKDSVVYNMISSREEASYDLVWVVWDGTLYCSIDGEVALGLPLNLLDESWTADKKYEIGFSSFDGRSTFDEFKIRNVSVKYGKKAEAELVTDGKVETSEIHKMAYEPITGSYIPASCAQDAYLYGTASSGNSGISADIEWRDKDNTASAVGVTVKVGDQSVQYVVEGINKQLRHQENHTWESVVWVQDALFKFAKPFDTDGNAQMTALVKDGNFYITYGDVQVLCVKLQALFPEYTKDSEVSVGLYTWDASNGLPHIKNVELLSEKEVAKASLKEWGYYSENQTIDAYDFVEGKVEKTTTGWKTVNLLGTAATWQVEGKLTREDARNVTDLMTGFQITSGDKKVEILGQHKGFAKIINGSWTDAFKYNGDTPTTYSFNDIIYPFFTKNRTIDELTFKAAIYNDVLYVWFNGEICWRVPLTEAEFGGFAAGSSYSLALRMADVNGKGNFEDLKVKMGYEVTDQTEFITYDNQTYSFTDAIAQLDANITRWDKFNLKRLAGVMADEVETTEVKSGGAYAYLKEASSDVYLSSTFSLLQNKKTSFFGIGIKQGNDSREIRFQHQGVTVMADNDWKISNVPCGDIYYFNTTGANGNYIWAQNIAGEYGMSKQIALKNMTEATTPKSYTIEWAITDGVLYGRHEGVVFMQIPLTKLCSSWTADKEYQIGFSQWDMNANGDVKNSDIVALYGEDALEKLVTNKKVTATEVKDFDYEVFTGSYVPRSAAEGKYIYSEATNEAQAVKATIKLVDKNNTGASNGITVKSGNQSAQIVVEGLNKAVRVQFNHAWGTPTTVTKLLPDGMTPYDADGVCKVTGIVKSDMLYILYNGKQAGSIELYKILPGYKTGDAVQLGIYAWDTKNGLATFSDVAFLTGEKATGIATNDHKWNVPFFTSEVSNANVDCIAGTAANTSGSTMNVNFAGESATWEITGKIKRSDLRTDDLRPGFFIRTGNQRLYVLGQAKGILFIDSGWNYDYNAYNAINKYAFNQDIYSFFKASDRDQEIEFKAIIANDVLYVWFDGVPSWRVPLTEKIKTANGATQTFAGFPAGSKYRFAVSIAPGHADCRGQFQITSVKTGAVDLNSVQSFENTYKNINFGN